MDTQRKRDLVRDYKEQKPRRGVFAVRCAATGQCWVSASMNLDKQQNSTWFSLRLGSFPNRALQAEWNSHGEAAFSYEVLEELNDDERGNYALSADLKALEAKWRAELNAGALTG